MPVDCWTMRPFCPVKPFKDTGQIGRSNPDSIILHDKNHLILPFMSRNAENRLFHTILDRIGDQLI